VSLEGLSALERKDELSDPTWLSIPGLSDLTPLTPGNAH
jgi:hypothetical protein